MKKTVNIIYLVVIFLLIFIPAVTMNTKKGQVSFIDNTYLPEFPNLSQDYESGKKQLEEYINKRIGLREQAIYLYEVAVAKVFDVLEIPIYTFGEEEHIFGCREYYVKDYQHLNTEESEEFVDAYTNYLMNVNQYLSDRGITFLFFMAPDKKTIYAEYYPQDVYVYDGISKSELILDKLEDKNIPYIYPKDIFLQEKENTLIYNKKYDVYHWNDFGNFLGNQMIDAYLTANVEGIIPLKKEQYSLTYSKQNKIWETVFPIEEEVPVYSLKDNSGIVEITESDNYLKENITGYQAHYLNNNLPDAPTILIFHDSYFGDSAKFYINRYSEVIAVHYYNYDNVQEIVEQYDPDIVLYENVERVIRADNDSYDVNTMNSWKVK